MIISTIILTYALIMTEPDGDSFVLDHGQTYQDCLDSMETWAGLDDPLTCELEPESAERD